MANWFLTQETTHTHTHTQARTEALCTYELEHTNTHARGEKIEGSFFWKKVSWNGDGSNVARRERQKQNMIPTSSLTLQK